MVNYIVSVIIENKPGISDPEGDTILNDLVLKGKNKNINQIRAGTILKFSIAEKDISFLVVMNEGLPEGVLSESDFVRKIAAEDRKSSDVLISEIMSYKFRSVDPDTTIEDAVQKMLNNNIRRLLILEDEKLVGVITQTDLARNLRDQLLVDGTIKSISNN